MSEKILYVQDMKLAAALLAMGVPPRQPEFIERISKNYEAPLDWFYFKHDPLFKHYVAAWDAREDFYTAQDENLGTVVFRPEHKFWFARLALRNRERLLDAVKNASKIRCIVERNGRFYMTTYEPKDRP